jgi:hypothetical protein
MTLPLESFKSFLKSILMSAFCNGWLSLKLTDRIFARFRFLREA